MGIRGTTNILEKQAVWLSYNKRRALKLQQIQWYTSIAALSHLKSLNSITEITDPLLRKEHADFWKGRSYADQIFTLRQIQEQSNEWISPHYINFIDFTTAFDSVNRLALKRNLSHYGIPCKLIFIIKNLFRDLSAKTSCGKTLQMSSN